MIIDSKFKLSLFPLELRVVKAFDFTEDPILLLEKDIIGNLYLSYLVHIEATLERRIYVQLSKDRLEKVVANEISVRNAFTLAENNHIYVVDLLLSSGIPIESYLVPTEAFNELNPIAEDYIIEISYASGAMELNQNEILDYSIRRNNLIFDFYLQSRNLVCSVKPYAIYKVFTPIVEIIKSLIGFDSRNADKFLEFSHIRNGSFGVTIEINYSQDLFLEKENKALETLINLLNAQEEKDFQNVIASSKNEKYLKEYITIIKTLIDNNATLHTAYANHISKKILTSVLDTDKAKIAKSIIDKTVEVIEDIEEIKGVFLEIDIDSKDPSFKIHSPEDDFILKGKFELSIIEKLKSDYVNIGTDPYLFTIKMLYYPETTIKAEEIKRYMIDYKRI